MKLSRHFILLAAMTFVMAPVTKIMAQDSPISELDAYKKVTVSQLEEAARQAPPTTGEKTTFPQLTASDMELAQTISLKDEATPVIFATVIRRKEQAVGVLAGYPVKGGVFNVFFSLEGGPDDGHPDLGVYLVNGARLGSIIFNQEGVGRVEPAPGIATSRPHFWQWLSCTGECIGDAQHACNSDPQCAILLIGSNIGGSVVGAGPIGSISIAMACSIACTRNPKLDLIANY